jgi:hypothetical protein
VAEISPAEASRLNSVVTKGRAEFADFDDRSNYVVVLADDKAALRGALAELPDAHQVVARLADDPDEAARILSLRGIRLAAELGRYAASKPTPAAAPQPVAPKPAPQPDIHDESLPMGEWAKLWDKRQAAKRSEPLPANRDIHDPNLPMRDFVRLYDVQERERQKARRAR